MFEPEFHVARRADLAARGVDRNRVRRRVLAQRWQEPVPGVGVGHSGALTLRERREVALVWGGASARLSHTSALLVHRARIEPPRGRGAGGRGARPVLDAGGRRVGADHRAPRPPPGEPWLRRGAITARTRRDVEQVVAGALQRRLTTVAELAEEVLRLGRRATPWLRDTLRDAARGMRSVGESDLRRVVVAEGLPEPDWGADVQTPEGTYVVDARWRHQRLVAEADGAAFHLGSKEWQDDLVRQNAIMATGDRLLRFPVGRLRREQKACGRELRRALGF